jgi:hypothetical protein
VCAISYMDLEGRPAFKMAIHQALSGGSTSLIEVSIYLDCRGASRLKTWAEN